MIHYAYIKGNGPSVFTPVFSKLGQRILQECSQQATLMAPPTVSQWLMGLTSVQTL